MLTKKQKRNNWILTVVLLIVSLLFLFPVIWMLANSFKPDAAITADMNSMAAFIPPALNGNFFENYVSVLTNTGFVRYMCNTLFETISSIVISFKKNTYVFFLDIFFEGLFVNFEKVYTFASANKRVGDLLNIVLWCNGSTTDSGPVSPGSSPG